MNHADLIARKAKLIKEENYLFENLCKDDKWHDVELAGYWIWAASCWIGSGLTCPTQRPHISTGGMGIHAKGQIPHIGHGGMDLSAPYNDNIYKWFRELSERLRCVRVVCGDWTRVCGGNWQDNMGNVGIFFDPPYGIKTRDTKLYHCDSVDIAHAVQKWCVERGKIAT